MRLEDLYDPADFCEGCGKRLPLDRYHSRKYCSEDCKNAHYSYLECEGRREALEGRTCERCGGPLARSRTANARYCSIECSRRANYRPRYPGTCQQCGKAYLAFLKNTKFCSHECFSKAAEKPPRPCQQCGKPFKNKPRVKYCSVACYAESRRGRPKGGTANCGR